MRFTALGGVAALVLAMVPGTATAQSQSLSGGGFQRRVIATGLQDPYEVVTAPDSSLWLTEKAGRRVLRINPATGRKQVALDLHSVVTHHGQDGLLGLALQERRGRVIGAFVSYTYATRTGYALRIVRYSTAKNGVTLRAPRTVLTGLPASLDHQGGKLRLGPDGLLYYTIGDQGGNHATYPCVENKAQRLPTAAEVKAHNWVAYQGKTLRMTTTGAIPPSNPVLRGVRSHVYAYGLRNPQGLDFGLGGRLFNSDQGQKTDDEINRLVRGGNYGWPHVAGYRDNKVYTYANWSKAAPRSCNSLHYSVLDIPPDVPQRKESDWRGAMVSPLTTAGSTVNNGFNFKQPICPAPAYSPCHPTFAPSSLTSYNHNTIPGWKGSLLVTSLKRGQVYRITSTGHLAQKLWTTPDRYRDTAVSPDGRTIYVATDRAGTVKLGKAAPTSRLRDRGAIIAYTYQGR